MLVIKLLRCFVVTDRGDVDVIFLIYYDDMLFVLIGRCVSCTDLKILLHRTCDSSRLRKQKADSAGGKNQLNF